MLKKVFAVFPVFIFFAFSGLFVFASSSSPVVFEVQHQDLTTAEKQDRTWQWIKSELRDNYTYLDFGNGLKSLLNAARNDDYNKKGSELEQKAKDWLLGIFVLAKTKDKTGTLEFLLWRQSFYLRWQKLRWNSLVNTSVGKHHIDALLNPKYAYLAKTPISIKKEGKEVYKTSLEPLFLAAKKFGVLETWEEFSKVKIPGFREIIWDFYFLFSVEESDINAALTAADAENKPKLDNLWTGIKNELKKPEYDKWKNTSIKIKNKNYDLKLLFAAAKDKTNVKGSALPLDAKLQLQELLNDQVTSKMIKNQLLALNQAEVEKNKQAEAEKNKQAKEKQQSQDLLIGLAIGGSVLVAAGLGGFLYWFFKIRK